MTAWPELKTKRKNLPLYKSGVLKPDIEALCHDAEIAHWAKPNPTVTELQAHLQDLIGMIEGIELKSTSQDWCGRETALENRGHNSLRAKLQDKLTQWKKDKGL